MDWGKLWFRIFPTTAWSFRTAAKHLSTAVASPDWPGVFDSGSTLRPRARHLADRRAVAGDSRTAPVRRARGLGDRARRRAGHRRRLHPVRPRRRRRRPHRPAGSGQAATRPDPERAQRIQPCPDPGRRRRRQGPGASSTWPGQQLAQTRKELDGRQGQGRRDGRQAEEGPGRPGRGQGGGRRRPGGSSTPSRRLAGQLVRDQYQQQSNLLPRRRPGGHPVHRGSADPAAVVDHDVRHGAGRDRSADRHPASARSRQGADRRRWKPRSPPTGGRPRRT